MNLEHALDLQVDEMDSLDQVWGEGVPGAANASVPVSSLATALTVCLPSTMSTIGTFG